MILFKLTDQQIKNLLYYETGFEQLHPIPPVHDWMKQRGWEYYTDYRCVRLECELEGSKYDLEFRDDQMMNMFILKWL